MLCIKSEAWRHVEKYRSSHGVNLARSVQRVMHKLGRGHFSPAAGRRRLSPWRRSVQSSAPPSASAASCPFPEDDKGNGGERAGSRWKIRTQLEQEVQRLQKQLQEEVDLHVALAYAVAHNAVPLMNSPSKLPYEAQYLLHHICELETTVTKLEDELVSLQVQIDHERNERYLAENHLGSLPSLLPEQPSSSSSSTWEEHLSSLRVSKSGSNQMPASIQEDQLHDCGGIQLVVDQIAPDIAIDENLLLDKFRECSSSEEENKMDAFDLESDSDSKKCLKMDPNQISEEMVRCMRNILLSLSESSDVSSKSPSEFLPSESSPEDHLSSSSFTSLFDSPILPSDLRSLMTEINSTDELAYEKGAFDFYKANQVSWESIGSYDWAAEVSSMSVGKAQLDYASEALKKFRLLVEQLETVNPASMSGNQRLAFWINVYNALIMHAYLAYGVPKSDVKLYFLMEKASYTVGGQSFSAADIEFIILKMKPPAHRPQLALILSLYKFKISEEHKLYCIDSPEPMTMFALSCGMHSSPAVRIFTAENVQDELGKSMRDYIRASIGISDNGKLLVPNLLHSYAKGVVEDSLLVDWICRYLSPDQVTIVRDSTSKHKQRLLGVRSFTVIPFDTNFRYLFLHDDKAKQR